MTNGNTPTVMGVFAHPDDEAFTLGATFAALAREGVRAYILCATRGEVGGIDDPSLATPQTLGEVREGELRCACEAMGIEPPIFLDYRDSGFGHPELSEHPECLVAAALDEVTEKVVRHIRELRPEVVFTFEPGGAYGHGDHVKIHEATRRAYYEAGDPTRFPEQLTDLEPHSPRRLLYGAVSREMVADAQEAMLAAGVDVSGWDDINLDNLGISDADINVIIDGTEHLDTKLRALACHRTQMFLIRPWTDLLDEALRRHLGIERFIQVEPPLEGVLRGSPAEVILGR